MQNQRKLPTQTKPTKVKKNSYDTRKRSTNPTIHRLKKTQQHVKKYENVTVILGDSMVKDLKGWELSEIFQRSQNESHALAAC